jgi:hypothetical protein
MFRGLDEAPTCVGEAGKISDELIADIRRWRDWKPLQKKGNLFESAPYIEWGIDPEAEQLFAVQRAEWLGMKRYSQRSGEVSGLAYTRALELAKKMAILLSADRIGPPPVAKNELAEWEKTTSISRGDAVAACAMVDFCMEEMAKFVKHQTSDGPISRAANLIYAYLKKHPGRLVSKAQITRGVRQVDSKEIRLRAIELLIDTMKIRLGDNGGYMVLE